MSGTVQLPSFATLGSNDVVALKLQNAGAAALEGGVTSFGQVFAKGDVAAGETLVASVGTATSAVQLDVKSYWDDGSVKMAVVTLERPALAAGRSVDVVLREAASSSAGADINLASALTGHSFVVDLTVSGKATQHIDVLAALQTALAKGTASVWQEGPLASQARVEIETGGSQRLIFDVTAWKGGGLSVEAQFNNDIAMGSSGGTVSYNAVVTMDGAVVANESVTQYQYQNWHESFSSNGKDGGQGLGDSAHGWLNIQHDIGALSATGAIADYNLDIGISQSLLNQYSTATKAADWGDPLATFGIATNMPGAGGRQDIGIVTQGNTAWLMTQDARAAAYAMGQAEGASSVTWHFYDAGHDTWLNTDYYPRVWTDPRGGTGSPGNANSTGLTQQVSGAAGWTADTAHQPELSYVPYLLTGERWILDNLYAQASFTEMVTYADQRLYGQGLVAREGGVRPVAWGLRELENAAFAAPDGTPEKAYFQKMADANWAWLVSQIPTWTNQQGETYGWLPPGAGAEIKPWQQDFLASTAIAAARRGSEDALTFLNWEANFLVGRFMNEASGFNPRDGIAYAIAMSASDGGAYFKTWAQMEAQTEAWGWSNGSGWDASAGYYAQLALATLSGIYELTGNEQARQAYWWLVSQNPPYISDATLASDPVFSLEAPPAPGVVVSPPPPVIPDNMQTGGAGADSLTGGAGNDTLLGAGGDDRLVGGKGHDSLVGGSGSDSLYGQDGNDTLDGGAGVDYLYGGNGDDVYRVDNARDAVREAANGGTDLVLATTSFTIGANVENLTLLGTGNFIATGNQHDNILIGNSGDNLLRGGSGGADTLIGGDGADSLNGWNGADSMVGGAGDDMYWVDNVNDQVVEAPGGGNDRVFTSVSITLAANVEEVMLYGPDSLVVRANELGNLIWGRAGPSMIFGLDGNDTIYDGAAADTIDGGNGADLISGGAGADSILGGAGNDTIYGGEGADTLTGGTGRDIFAFNAANQFGDRITDFAPGFDDLQFTRATLSNTFDQGTLPAAAFHEGATPAGAMPQFDYDTATGVLRWDADGAGGTPAVIVATLVGAPHLTASDIVII